MIAKEVRPESINPVSGVKVVAAEVGDDAPQWRKDLARDGWAVVKGAVDPQKAKAYADKANDWLEGFELGYKRDDPSTWHKEYLPRHDLGGLYAHYSVAHAQFVWDIKAEPGIVSLFEQIWGTDKLTVSFDGGNLAVPLPKSEISNGAAPWPHTDQSPLKPELASIQGLLNLLPNGPDDGGLTVMTGSANLFPDIWQAFEDDQPEGGWPKNDHIKYKDSWVKWLEERGCRTVKPCLEPGDFILWDSRCVHWGQAPLGGKHRFAVYVCYKPFDWMDDEAAKKKLEYFEKGYCTSHDPITFVPKNDQDAEWNTPFPYGRPQLSEQCKKAVGLEAY